MSLRLLNRIRSTIGENSTFVGGFSIEDAQRHTFYRLSGGAICAHHDATLLLSDGGPTIWRYNANLEELQAHLQLIDVDAIDSFSLSGEDIFVKTRNDSAFIRRYDYKTRTRLADVWGGDSREYGCLASHNGKLYVTNTNRCTVSIFEITNGKVSINPRIYSVASDANERPTEITIAPDGTVYVLFTWEKRITYGREDPWEYIDGAASVISYNANFVPIARYRDTAWSKAWAPSNLRLSAVEDSTLRVLSRNTLFKFPAITQDLRRDALIRLDLEDKERRRTALPQVSAENTLELQNIPGPGARSSFSHNKTFYAFSPGNLTTFRRTTAGVTAVENVSLSNTYQWKADRIFPNMAGDIFVSSKVRSGHDDLKSVGFVFKAHSSGFQRHQEIRELDSPSVFFEHGLLFFRRVNDHWVLTEEAFPNLAHIELAVELEPKNNRRGSLQRIISPQVYAIKDGTVFASTLGAIARFPPTGARTLIEGPATDLHMCERLIVTETKIYAGSKLDRYAKGTVLIFDINAMGNTEPIARCDSITSDIFAVDEQRARLFHLRGHRLFLYDLITGDDADLALDFVVDIRIGVGGDLYVLTMSNQISIYRYL